RLIFYLPAFLPGVRHVPTTEHGDAPILANFTDISTELFEQFPICFVFHMQPIALLLGPLKGFKITYVALLLWAKQPSTRTARHGGNEILMPVIKKRIHSHGSLLRQVCLSFKARQAGRGNSGLTSNCSISHLVIDAPF